VTDYLDFLGLQRSSTVGTYHSRFGAAAVGVKLLAALPVYADLLLRAHLPEDGFEAARDLALQGLAGVEDEPRQKLLIKLREHHFPSPLGRNAMGQKEDLEQMLVADARNTYKENFRAKGTILSIAGDVDFHAYSSEIERLFAEMPSGHSVAPVLVEPTVRYWFEEQKSEQTHIGIAYPSVPETDPEYYVARLAVETLSGGSGRLFTEVREKRGLCYSVWAGYASLEGMGAIMGYAGTSNDRAQATLDTFVAELHRLTEGVSEDELSRAKIGMKSSLIMSGESTSSRASALAHDWFTRGRLRTLGEIAAAIDGVNVSDVNAYLKRHPPGPFTFVIVGPKELRMPA
jgi:predicted Zn-dependent peptidase